MKVFLKVSIDVSAVEPGQKFDPEQVKEAVQEAIYNAIRHGEGAGHSHAMSDQLSLLMDYVEVYDSDMTDEF